MVKPIPQPQAISTLSRACLLAGSTICLLLGAGGCGSAHHGELFELAPEAWGGSPSVGNGGGGGGAGSSGMEASSGGSGGESVAGSAGNAAFGGSGNGGSGAGCAFSCGDGGRGGNPSDSAGAAGVSGQAGSGSESTDCSAFAADATFLPATQHCYLVDTEPRTFALAQAHCKTLDAHLITLNSQAENDFAWSIHAQEHWIGTKDGKAPKQPGVGTYTWITEEPFDYTNWSADQPNASGTECGEGNGNGTCYEHCGFQWLVGEHGGLWNDRYCLHTIASICEWDSAP